MGISGTTQHLYTVTEFRWVHNHEQSKLSWEIKLQFEFENFRFVQSKSNNATAFGRISINFIEYNESLRGSSFNLN